MISFENVPLTLILIWPNYDNFATDIERIKCAKTLKSAYSWPIWQNNTFASDAWMDQLCNTLESAYIWPIWQNYDTFASDASRDQMCKNTSKCLQLANFTKLQYFC